MMTDSLEAEILEANATHSLVLADLKLRNIQLKATARRLKNDVLHDQVFKELYAEIDSEYAETYYYRNQTCTAMENALIDLEHNCEGNSGTIRVVRRELLEVEKTNNALRSELLKLEKSERQHLRNQITIDYKSLIQSHSLKEYQGLLNAMEEQQLLRAQLEANTHVLELEIGKLQDLKKNLSLEQENCKFEVDDIRILAAITEKARNREAVLDRFISKNMKTPVYSCSLKLYNEEIEQTKKIANEIRSEIRLLEDKLNETLLLTKLRVEVDKMTTSLLHTIGREEDTSNALVNLVNQSGNSSGLL